MNANELREKVRAILFERCSGDVETAIEEVARLVETKAAAGIRCEWHGCGATATIARKTDRGTIWDICHVHDQEGWELEYWSDDEGSDEG